MQTSRYQVRPPGSTGRVLRILLLCTGAGTMLVGLVTYTYLQRHVFSIPAAGADDAYRNFAPWMDSPWIVLAWGPSLISQATMVIWLIWQHQATANLWALGHRDLKITPGWAVGWWFIPFANFGMPLVAMLELDRRSTPDGRPRPASPLLGWWWASWLAYSVVPAVLAFAAVIPGIADLSRTYEDARALDLTPMMRALAPAMLLAGLLHVVAAVLAYRVVARIDAAQSAFVDARSLMPPRPDTRPS